jgi:hypothetical protein
VGLLELLLPKTPIRFEDLDQYPQPRPALM